jgi:hypothetical protein
MCKDCSASLTFAGVALLLISSSIIFGLVFSVGVTNAAVETKAGIKVIHETIRPIGNQTIKSAENSSRIKPFFVNPNSLVLVNRSAIKSLLVNLSALKPLVKNASAIKSLHMTRSITNLIVNHGISSSDPNSVPDTAINGSLDCNNSSVPNGGSTAFNCITFGFAGTPSTQLLECSLDTAPFQACIINAQNGLPLVAYSSGSITYTGLTAGPHTFRVYALAGDPSTGQPFLRDPTPASLSWSINNTLQYLDSDGDGLPDNWEQNGIDINNDGIVDFNLTNHGASPMHKDIYVEIDYMQHHRPRPESINHVIGNFSNAPVTNPDNRSGIKLNVQVDDPITETSDRLLLMFPDDHTWPAFDDIKTLNGCNLPSGLPVGCFGTAVERADPNAINILAAKRLIYHYALFVHTYDLLSDPTGDTSSSGISEIFGNDLIISLGDDIWGTEPPGNQPGSHHVGSIDEQEGAFMHELGHNLGLRHGGNENLNCKPNYFSIMSYSREFSEFDPTRPLDYSGSVSPSLNENSHDERVGIAGPLGLKTFYGPLVTDPGVPGSLPFPRLAITGQALDYSVPPDGNTVDSSVSSDLDSLGFADCQQVSTYVTLESFDDWHNLKYDFRAGSAFPEGAHGLGSLSDPVPSPRHVNSDTSRPEFTGRNLVDSRILLLNGLDYSILNLPDNSFKQHLSTSPLKVKLHNLLVGTSTNDTEGILNKTKSGLGEILRSEGSSNKSSIASFLQTNQLSAAIKELMQLRSAAKSILNPGPQDVLLEQIDNFILILQKQE